MIQDPKYIDVPNICFSLTSATDIREIEFSTQRIERGFDDSEMWDLTTTIARFIIPRLERYQELANEFLVQTPDEINAINSFLNALKLIQRNSGEWNLFTKDEQEQVIKGLGYFSRIFMTLTL